MAKENEPQSLAEIHDRERLKWDALAHSASESDLLLPPDASFASYAAESTTLPGVAEFLGDLAGKRVIEYGCGLGRITVLLARSGAQVDAFDISPESVEVARRRAEVNGLGDRIRLSVAVAEELPYDDSEFDLAFGKAVLHHLDVASAGPELLRVLRPGGRAAFSEPLGMNPLLTMTRDHVWYPGKRPVGDDKPLTYDDVHAWGAGFGSFRYREIQLLGMLERAFGAGARMPRLQRLDERLLGAVPGLRRLCRYVVLFMQR